MDVFLYKVRNSYFDKRILSENEESSIYLDYEVTAYQKGWSILKHHHHFIGSWLIP